jgi:hypothetical protein
LIKINSGGISCALSGRVERAPQLLGALAAHVIEKSNYFFILEVILLFFGGGIRLWSCFHPGIRSVLFGSLDFFQTTVFAEKSGGLDEATKRFSLRLWLEVCRLSVF